MPDTRLTIKLTRKQRDEIVALLDTCGDEAALDYEPDLANRCFHLAGLLSKNVVSSQQNAKILDTTYSK